MTIFRFSATLAALCLLAACNEPQSQHGSTSPQATPKIEPIYRLSIKRGGQPVEPGELLRAFNENPNRLAIDNQNKVFDLRAKIAKVPEFNEELDRTSGYYLPLKMYDGEDDWMIEEIGAQKRGLPRVDSVSMFVLDFSQARAARLKRGELITAKCPKLRIVQDGLVFDDCKIGGI